VPTKFRRWVKTTGIALAHESSSGWTVGYTEVIPETTAFDEGIEANRRGTWMINAIRTSSLPSDEFNFFGESRLQRSQTPLAL
jgi:hypothetical protein